MKKILKLLIIILIMIPILINATLVTHDSSINYANSYIDKPEFVGRNKFLLLKGKIPYLDNNSNLNYDERFKLGGLISKPEYELTLKDGKSYLTTGIEYWLATKENSGKAYYVENYLRSKNITETSNTRVTEFVNPNVKVVGTGSYSNAWELQLDKVVTVKTNSMEYASIDGKSEQTKLISSNSVSFKFNITPGYKYLGQDDCKGSLSGNTYMMSDISNDITCTAVFDARVYRISLIDPTIVLEKEPKPGNLYYKYTKSGLYGSYNSEWNLVSDKVETIETPERTGYRFDGYKFESNEIINKNGKILVEQLSGFDLDIDIIQLKPKWIPNSYTVTFNVNGGTAWTNSTCTSPSSLSGSTCTKSVTYASTYGTLPTPNRTGYTFAGWYTAASGGSKRTASSTVSITSNTTLYAHWTAKTYTVTFNVNGGTAWTSATCLSPSSLSGSTCTKTVTYASTYGDLPTPTRSGYTFDGWYTDATNGTQVTSSTSVSITSNQILYAHWTANSYFMFEYTGNYTVVQGTSSTSGNIVTMTSPNWVIKFTSSGILTSYTNTNIDAYLVGGGAGGQAGNWSRDGWGGYGYGGIGGAGGSINNSSNISLSTSSYAITIGSGGAGGSDKGANGQNGGATSAFNITATGGTANSGGAGGRGYSYCDCPGIAVNCPSWDGSYTHGSCYYNGGNGATGSYAFNDSNIDNIVLGSSGGGGAGYAGYSDGASPGTGGTNAGNGGIAAPGVGGNGVTNTGGGGGGGGGHQYYTTGNSYANGGAGGSGVVYIRNHN